MAPLFDQRTGEGISGDRAISGDAIAERDAIIAELVKLVQTVSEGEIACITAMDFPGDPRNRHVAALHDEIFTQSCVMTEEQIWYPSEAVEQAAYVPSLPGRAFEIASAILMINEMLETTTNARTIGFMEFRWERIGSRYLSIDAQFRRPIFRGFRWLSEHNDSWDAATALSLPTRQEIHRL